jgi:hypothetical protein
MTKLHTILDLPKIPKEFVDLAFERAEDEIGDIQNPQVDRVYLKDGKTFASRRNQRFGLEDAMADWVTENIAANWLHIGVVKSYSTTLDSDSELNNLSNGPHSDVTRNFTLFYLIEQGNPDQDTVFWQEPGKPLRRERAVNINNSVNDISNLKEVDRIRIPMEQWVYFDVRVLHSAENIKKSRLAIHIGFDEDPFDFFKE